MEYGVWSMKSVLYGGYTLITQDEPQNHIRLGKLTLYRGVDWPSNRSRHLQLRILNGFNIGT